MSTQSRPITLGFDHEPICAGEHICLIYRNEEERLEVLSRYLGSGLEAGEKVLSLVDTTSPSEFVDIMGEYGLDLKAMEVDTEILQANSVYKPDGDFVPQKMIDAVSAKFRKALKQGYIGWRGAGEMTWAVTAPQTPMDDLVEYESQINEMLQAIPATVFCQYDARKFDGATLMDILAVHPMMVVGGQLIRNPMYRNLNPSSASPS